jgi:membrane associated rhomboid family serine protease
MRAGVGRSLEWIVMSSGADLFVVCKQCGSEVSPYITECPYCGNRLRRRAPKLPRARPGGDAPRPPRRPIFGRLKTSPLAVRRRRGLSSGEGRWVASRPYATIGLVMTGAAAWIVWHAEPLAYLEMAIFGPLHGDWWKIFTSQFIYENGLYAFLTLATIAIFGWLLERRHGPLVVFVLFVGAGSVGALVATAVYPFPVVAGGNAGALALLMAWAVPDLVAARRRSYYEGDLLGAAAIAALLLAIPYAYPEASWLAGVTGAAIGLLFGLGLRREAPDDL